MNPEEDEWEYLGLCYGCIGSTSEECAANGGSCLEEEEGDDDYELTSRNRVDVPILPRPDVPRGEQPQSSQEQGAEKLMGCPDNSHSSHEHSRVGRLQSLGDSSNHVRASPMLRCFCTHATTHASGPLSVCVYNVQASHHSRHS